MKPPNSLTTTQEWDKLFKQTYPGTIHHSFEAYLGGNCKDAIIDYLHQRDQAIKKSVIQEVLEVIDKELDAWKSTLNEVIANKEPKSHQDTWIGGKMALNELKDNLKSHLTEKV